MIQVTPQMRILLAVEPAGFVQRSVFWLCFHFPQQESQCHQGADV